MFILEQRDLNQKSQTLLIANQQKFPLGMSTDSFQRTIVSVLCQSSMSMDLFEIELHNTTESCVLLREHEDIGAIIVKLEG